MLLTALLASASLQLHPVGPGQADLHLCFEPASPAVRYELLIIARGPAGRSQTRQSGVADSACPVRNSLRLAATTKVEARLRWWVEGLEQEPVTTEISL